MCYLLRALYVGLGFTSTVVLAIMEGKGYRSCHWEGCELLGLVVHVLSSSGAELAVRLM